MVKNTKLLKEKEDLLMSVDQSLKVTHLARSTKGDSSLKRRPRVQPRTSTSVSRHSCGKLGHVSIIARQKKSLSIEYVDGCLRRIRTKPK